MEFEEEEKEEGEVEEVEEIDEEDKEKEKKKEEEENVCVFGIETYISGLMCACKLALAWPAHF